MKYYRLEIDLFDSTCWYIDKIEGVDNYRLVAPPMLPIDDELRKVSFECNVKTLGRPVDFNQAGSSGVLIVRFNIIQALSGLGGFTTFPIFFKNIVPHDMYRVLHVWEVVDCFDEEKSSFEKYERDNPVTGDKVGDYYAVTNLRLDAEKIVDKHIFRVKRLESALIVSEALKEKLVKSKISGAMFTEV